MSIISLVVVGSAIALAGEAARAVPAGEPLTSTVVSLDGNQRLLATDPTNVGRGEEWFKTPRPEAKPTKVPWIIQDKRIPYLTKVGLSGSSVKPLVKAEGPGFCAINWMTPIGSTVGVEAPTELHRQPLRGTSDGRAG